MTLSRADGPAGHQEVWELLPWYANGTLAAAESAPVEAHLERCALCRRELELCRAMATAVDAAGGLPLAGAASGSPRARPGGDELDEVLADDPRPTVPPQSPAGASGLAGAAPRAWWSATPRPARRALLAQAAVLGLVVVGIAFLAGRSGWPGEPGPARPGVFHTLSEPGTGAPAAEDGTSSVRLVLRDDATTADLRRLLTEVGGEIVAGPSPAGVLTVRLAASEGNAPATATALERLRADPAVLFAEPVVVRSSGNGPPENALR